MAKWICPVCGYVHEGDAAPERCPMCKVPGNKFNLVEEGKAITDNNGATLKFVYDTPTAQIYTGTMTGLVGTSTPQTPPEEEEEDNNN